MASHRHLALARGQPVWAAPTLELQADLVRLRVAVDSFVAVMRPLAAVAEALVAAELVAAAVGRPAVCAVG